MLENIPQREMQPTSHDETRDGQVYDELLCMMYALNPEIGILNDQLADDKEDISDSPALVKSYPAIETITPDGVTAEIFVSIPQHRDRLDRQPRMYIGAVVGDEVMAAKIIKDSATGNIKLVSYEAETGLDEQSRFNRIHDAIVKRRSDKN